MEVETESIYHMRVGDSKELAKTLALFKAKRAAVDIGGRYLSKKGLIEFYERKREEIYNLAADIIESRILEEKWISNGKRLRVFVRIKSDVHPSDFITAELTNLQLERGETKESFREEMEPQIIKTTKPGFDLAKAYRLMRRSKWRVSVIYLDRLEKKYPNWGAIFLAKSHAYYVLHEFPQMKGALAKACELDNTEACDDLEKLKRVHEHDFSF
ncbi:MAG: hypothetical protein JSW26_14875 [Desulfobacterales bacterium]|nr:MAG: hypothetical protein JSW26_14875 [Desulfobacterales bacterium]